MLETLAHASTLSKLHHHRYFVFLFMFYVVGDTSQPHLACDTCKRDVFQAL